MPHNINAGLQETGFGEVDLFLPLFDRFGHSPIPILLLVSRLSGTDESRIIWDETSFSLHIKFASQQSVSRLIAD